MNTPTVDQVMQSKDAHTYLKDTLKVFLEKDPVDALYDAKLLVKVLENRLNELMGA